jgi:hypothetical protein
MSRSVDRSTRSPRIRSLGIVALLVCGVACSGPLSPLPVAHRPQYGQAPEDLANALVQMARASHTPIIAELVWPLPKIPTAEGKPLNSDTLNDLLKLAPGYEWKVEGKTVHFY